MMKNFRRFLMITAMLCSVPFGILANAQKKEDPPPKESRPKVVNEQKKDNPRGNSNSGQNNQGKGDKKKP